MSLHRFIGCVKNPNIGDIVDKCLDDKKSFLLDLFLIKTNLYQVLNCLMINIIMMLIKV